MSGVAHITDTTLFSDAMTTVFPFRTAARLQAQRHYMRVFWHKQMSTVAEIFWRYTHLEKSCI